MTLPPAPDRWTLELSNAERMEAVAEALKARPDEREQIGHATQIPVGVADLGMPQVRHQVEEPRLDVDPAWCHASRR